MLTNNQIEPVPASTLNSQARVKNSVDESRRISARSATVGVFLAWVLQALLGAEFLIALAASLRYTHTISRPAMLADGIFLIAATALCYRVATGRWKLEWSRLQRRNFMAALILAGVALRIIWVLVMPPVQLSDAKDYLTLSRTLLSTGSYVDYETGTSTAGFPRARLSGVFSFFHATTRRHGVDARNRQSPDVRGMRPVDWMGCRRARR